MIICCSPPMEAVELIPPMLCVDCSCAASCWKFVLIPTLATEEAECVGISVGTGPRCPKKLEVEADEDVELLFASAFALLAFAFPPLLPAPAAALDEERPPSPPAPQVGEGAGASAICDKMFATVELRMAPLTHCFCPLVTEPVFDSVEKSPPALELGEMARFPCSPMPGRTMEPMPWLLWSSPPIPNPDEFSVEGVWPGCPPCTLICESRFEKVC